MLGLYIGSGIIGVAVIFLLLSILLTYRNGNKHATAWRDGTTPRFRKFQGEYKITMYPRWIWWWFWDIKIFNDDHGLNVAFGVFAWGKRIVVERYSSSFEGALLDYSGCWWPWRIIRDYVKSIKGNINIFIGKFCIKIPVIGEIQLAWFTM